MDIDENLQYSLLLDIYSPLLTNKQCYILHDYLDKNLGLSEIAQTRGSSKQAVKDLIDRTLSMLKGYEQKLHLLAKFNEIKVKINKILQNFDKIEEKIKINEQNFIKNQTNLEKKQEKNINLVESDEKLILLDDLKKQLKSILEVM